MEDLLGLKPLRKLDATAVAALTLSQVRWRSGMKR